MMIQTIESQRETAMALLKAGLSVADVAAQLQRSEVWVRKWRRRFEQEGYSGLQSRSRAPKNPQRLACEVREGVIAARLQLEKQASCGGDGLKYVGGQAIRTVLQQQGYNPLPSVPTIERVLRAAGLTKRKQERVTPKIAYPRLSPDEPHQLMQVDIVPHYLRGGERVACFNAIDVVSRHPVGRAYSQRRSCDAAAFLLHAWQTNGVPTYTQVDNEGCFSGGTTHPYVLGKVLRLALAAGTELVFSPPYHPQSNGYVERFHQDYNQHVWQETYLTSLADVNRKADRYFALYRQSQHHSKLQDVTPTDRHWLHQHKSLAQLLPVPKTKQPLVSGNVHFMRHVAADNTIRVLNVDWAVPCEATTGVWATLSLTSKAAWLRIYDQAPDRPERQCLVSHPFSLDEPVLARAEAVSESSTEPLPEKSCDEAESISAEPQRSSLADVLFVTSLRFAQHSLKKTLELTNQLLE